MGKLSNVKVGDTRADGAVCTKVEWAALDTWGNDERTFYSEELGLTKSLGLASRYKSPELAAYGHDTNRWKAVRVVTWKKPKKPSTFDARPINGDDGGQYSPSHAFRIHSVKAEEVRDILGVIDSHMDCKCGASMALAVVGSMLIAATGVERP